MVVKGSGGSSREGVEIRVVRPGVESTSPVDNEMVGIDVCFSGLVEALGSVSFDGSSFLPSPSTCTRIVPSLLAFPLPLPFRAPCSLAVNPSRLESELALDLPALLSSVSSPAVLT